MDKTRFKKKDFSDKSNRDKTEEGDKKKVVYRGPAVLGHAPAPSICSKVTKTFRSMIKWRNTNRYRKDAILPFAGGDKEIDNTRQVVKTKKGEEITIGTLNEIWRDLMPGPRPKKRMKNVRMPEPKATGKKR